MKKIILIGAGGHAKSCIDVIEYSGEYELTGLIDIKEKVGESLLGYPIIDSDENIAKYINNDTYFLITIGHLHKGSSEKRRKIFEKLKENGAKFATVISKDAYVSKNAKIGEGTIVMHNAFLNTGAEVGKNCIINNNAHLEHDVKVKDHCHISTATVLNGEVIIGEETFVGSHSTVVQCLNIKDKTFIKAHSLIKASII